MGSGAAYGPTATSDGRNWVRLRIAEIEAVLFAGADADGAERSGRWLALCEAWERTPERRSVLLDRLEEEVKLEFKRAHTQER